MSIPDSFLLEEVRCDFVIPSAVKQAWAAELEVLLEIDRVCRKHQISYFADWGTLLGAARHGGFVPWDDDLDIVMKRKDYEKFREKAVPDMEKGFHMQTFRNQQDMWLFMGKVVGKNHFCFEKEHLQRFHNFPYIACVDVFVLDYVYRDADKEQERRTLCKYMLGVADAIVEGRLSPGEREQSLCTIEEMTGKEIRRIADAAAMGRALYEEVERIFAQVPEQESDTLTQMFPFGLQGKALHFPKKYFERAVRLPFETTTIPVPLYYDTILKTKYGNYWRVNKNAGGHNYPFFEGQKVNLQKVLEKPLPEFRFEADKWGKSLSGQDANALSYKEMAKEGMEELVRMEGSLLTVLEQAKQEKTGSLGGTDWREACAGLLQDGQQLAIALGTMLEQMPGDSSRIVGMLEQYCENLFCFYEQGTQENWERIHHMRKQIENEIDNIRKRKTVLFLPVLAKDWKSMQCLWQMAKNEKNCEVLVAPLTYYYKNYAGFAEKICCEREQFPEEVQTLEDSLLTEEYLQMLHPEQIVIQNPYDNWNPIYSVAPNFYTEKIRKYTQELIFVPAWNGRDDFPTDSRDFSNMKYYVTMPGCVYADKILVPSAAMREQYIRRLTAFAGKETEEGWCKRMEIMVPKQALRTEEAASHGEDIASKASLRKICYGINWANYETGGEAYLEKFRKNCETLHAYAEKLTVTLCFFPQEAHHTTEIQEFEKRIASFSNIQWEENNTPHIQEYAAYYGDSMPLALAFCQAGRPVLLQDIPDRK